jgi:hypothetical protein
MKRVQLRSADRYPDSIAVTALVEGVGAEVERQLTGFGPDFNLIDRTI